VLRCAGKAARTSGDRRDAGSLGQSQWREYLIELGLYLKKKLTSLTRSSPGNYKPRLHDAGMPAKNGEPVVRGGLIRGP